MSIPELLTLKDIARLTKIAERTLRRWDMAGRMPQPIRCGKRIIRWRVDVIERWIVTGMPDRKTFEAKSKLASGK